MTDESGSNVLFQHHEEQQCKVHNFCQTVTLTSTNAETGQRSRLHQLDKNLFCKTMNLPNQHLTLFFSYSGNFAYSGCGDPYNAKFEWGNILPVVPVSENDHTRQRQCQTWGCYESVLGCMYYSIVSQIQIISTFKFKLTTLQ